jgi:hypothetical protein
MVTERSYQLPRTVLWKQQYGGAGESRSLNLVNPYFSTLTQPEFYRSFCLVTGKTRCLVNGNWVVPDGWSAFDEHVLDSFVCSKIPFI